MALATAHQIPALTGNRVKRADMVDLWELEYPPRRMGKVFALSLSSGASEFCFGDWMLIAVDPQLWKPNPFVGIVNASLWPRSQQVCTIHGPLGGQTGSLVPGLSACNLGGIEFKAWRILLAEPLSAL